MATKKKIVVKSAQVKIVPSKEKMSERIYSNYVVIDHSEYDFTLKFCDIPALTDEEKMKVLQTKKIEALVQTEMVIPVALVQSLINALSENFGTYIKTYAKTGKK